MCNKFLKFLAQYFLKHKGVSAIEGISPIQYILIDGVNVAYRVLGQGPILILLQGYRMNMHNWEPDLLKHLAKHFRIYIFDYPGIGRSSVSHHKFDLEFLSDILSQFIHKLCLKPKALIGYSMGGYLAQYFIVKHPEQINSVVLIGTHLSGKNAIFCSQKTIHQFCDLSGSVEEQLMRLLNLMFPEAVKSRMLRHMLIISASSQLEGDVPRAIVVRQQAIIERWCYGKSITPETLQILSQKNIPTLIVMGEKDELVSFDNAKMLQKVFKQSQLIAFKDAGHGLIYQHPVEIAEAICKFLL